MLHNFLMAAREAGFTQRRFREDPGAIAESFVRAVETYGYDGVLVDVDTVVLAEALGVPVDRPEDMPARPAGALIGSLAEARDLDPAALGGHPRVQVWLEAVRRLVAHFRGEVFVRGNCDQAAFSSGLHGPRAGRVDDGPPRRREPRRRPRPPLVLRRGICLVPPAHGRDGADMVSNGDSPAGPDLISPVDVRRIRPAVRAAASSIEAHRLGLPYALHICGDTTRILGPMLATGADALELDYKTDVRGRPGRAEGARRCSSATSIRAAFWPSGRPRSSRPGRASFWTSSPARRGSFSTPVAPSRPRPRRKTWRAMIAAARSWEPRA
ncbi:MAG: hypothetical protein MZU84_08425 [Sphingobacterium sp.]|nr:hypothetical protein [Sphingobacterium sp.]